IGDKQHWLVKIRYRVAGNLGGIDGKAPNIFKRDNRIAQCIQRKTLAPYITQQMVAGDCTSLINEIIEKPQLRWHASIQTPLLWKSDMGPAPVRQARPVHWRGIRYFCEIVVAPEPRRRYGAEEDTFTVAEVLDAARAIRDRCTNGFPMRTGKFLVGPKGKWAASIVFPSVWPPPPSAAAGNISMPNLDSTG
ncbi:MAG: hypothetical protein Q9214_007810, partial [Letrouitia sp. 1 TL-2023]